MILNTTNVKHQTRFLALRCSTIIMLLAGAINAAELPQSLKPFMVNHCFDCHGNGSSEGGLALNEVGADLGDPATFATWERIFDRVTDSEMPPKDADQPKSAERVAFSRALQQPLAEAHAAQKGTVLRRLNRREYQNTLNDIFGTNLDLESMFPEDGRSHEFDNVGESLSLSMVQLRQYLEAVDAVLDTAIESATTKPEPTKKTANYADTREGETHLGKAWKLAADGAVVFFRRLGYPTGMLRTANVRETGRYRIRVTGYAYQSDTPITFSVGATTFQRGVAKPTFGYFEFGPGKPKSIELEAWMPRNYMIEITPWGISDDNYEIKKHGIDNYKGPGLAINHVEIEGPLIDEFPSRGHRLVFDGLDRREIEPSNPNVKRKPWYKPEFEIVSNDLKSDVRKVLHRVATSAFRRPAQPEQMDQYLALFNSETRAGANTEDALRTAVAAIFCSPDFLYLQEAPGQLDDYAIAARLAYFLTRTTPDRELLEAAAAGRLSQGHDEIIKQTQRLMNDQRHQRFVVDFTDAWLNLRDIEFTSPDRNLYPEFDQFLQFSMIEETRQFFALLVRENLPVRNIVASEFAMLNNRLAAHYEIANVSGPKLRQVSLPADSRRGGFLSQGSVLKVSANGTNTSPVVRGVWVMERILGITPQPPPPGVPGVEPDIRGASTLRDLLAKHRDSDNCRSCHAMIDPPGFALESFNPIGGWRDHFRSLGKGKKVDIVINARKVRYRIGQPVDSSGELQDGTRFAGFTEYREFLARDEDRLAKTLAKKLLTFACGREMGFSDRRLIDQIVEKSEQNGHRIRDLIELVTTSEVFLNK